MHLRISTVIKIDDDLNGEEIEQIRSDFEDVASNNTIGYDRPKVTIEELN